MIGSCDAAARLRRARGRPEEMVGNLRLLQWVRCAAIVIALLWQHGANADTVESF